MSSDDRQHKMLTAVLVGVAVTVVISVLLIVFGLPAIVHGADNSDALKRANDLQACRSEANTRVTDAADRLDAAQANVSDTIAAILVASLRSDRAAARALGPELEVHRASLDAAAYAKTLAVVEYRDAVRLSRTDPSKFLRQCRSHP